MKTTKFLLHRALFTGGPLYLVDGTHDRSVMTIVNSVEREDGSNRSFNVTGYGENGLPLTIHVTTVD